MNTELEEALHRHSYWLKNIKGGVKFCYKNHPDLDLKGKDISERLLRKADFFGFNLKGTKLRRADLTGANFANTNLSDVDFTNSNLICADFSGSSMVNVNFTNVALNDANLNVTSADSIIFNCADLFGSRISGVWQNVEAKNTRDATGAVMHTWNLT